MRLWTGREAEIIRIMADVIRDSATIGVVIIDWGAPAPHNAWNLPPTQYTS